MRFGLSLFLFCFVLVFVLNMPPIRPEKGAFLHNLYLFFISPVTGAAILAPVTGGIQNSTLTAQLIWIFSDPAAPAVTRPQRSHDNRGRKQEVGRLPDILYTQSA